MFGRQRLEAASQVEIESITSKTMQYLQGVMKRVVHREWS